MPADPSDLVRPAVAPGPVVMPGDDDPLGEPEDRNVPDGVPGDPSTSLGEPPARTRRAVLAAGVGALVGVVAAALGRPLPASAANGSPTILGRLNSASASTTVSTSSGYGLYGRSASRSGRGVYGSATATSGTTYGVYGASASPTGVGVRGAATSGSPVAAGATGVLGTSANPWGIGVRGVATSTAAGFNVGVSGEGRGVPQGTGVQGIGSFAGVLGTSAAEAGHGVRGEATGVHGIGVHGRAAPTGLVVDEHVGVLGEGLHSQGIGVKGIAHEVQGTGVVGLATATGPFPTWGVRGEAASEDGVGLQGLATTATGEAAGVSGTCSSAAGVGVRGLNAATSGNACGIAGQTSANGLWASGVKGTATTGPSIGVYGLAQGDSGSVGVFGSATSGYAVYADNPGSGYSIYAVGRATIADDLVVAGTLSKAAGSFRIDHPLDPANRYLRHSFVESPDMKNVYDGVATLDADGAATVELPAWFEALNGELRYQLTAMGVEMPGLHVARGVKDNRFQIGGGAPGGDVCWQVTGIRRDAYAEAHRIPVEEPKTGREKGRYLHPREHGKPEGRGIAALHARRPPGE